MPRHTLVSKRETIVAAGALGTPKLLLQSGIGPRAALTALDIPVIVDNPSVGANMSDHVLLTSVYEVNSTVLLQEGAVTNDQVFKSPALETYTEEWKQHRTGPLSNSITNQLGFLRLPENDPIWRGERDPSSGKNSAHWELLFAVCSYFSSQHHILTTDD